MPLPWWQGILFIELGKEIFGYYRKKMFFCSKNKPEKTIFQETNIIYKSSNSIIVYEKDFFTFRDVAGSCRQCDGSKYSTGSS
jgi:excinuclease UvrABC ATPase subunit